MCGILGYIGHRQATDVLLDGLKRLEYRGYDSAGVAVMNHNGVQLRRSVGKLDQLEKLLIKNEVPGTMGLGHTRWATHGVPSEINAHPHDDGKHPASEYGEGQSNITHDANRPHYRENDGNK